MRCGLHCFVDVSHGRAGGGGKVAAVFVFRRSADQIVAYPLEFHLGRTVRRIHSLHFTAGDMAAGCSYTDP